jgi:hypothetical protein
MSGLTEAASAQRCSQKNSFVVLHSVTTVRFIYNPGCKPLVDKIDILQTGRRRAIRRSSAKTVSLRRDGDYANSRER